MHTQDTKDRFIELRVRGWSLARIAAEIGVTPRTCIAWQKQFKTDIEDLQTAHREALEERIFNTHEEEMTRLASLLNSVDRILAEKSLQTLPPTDLFRLMIALRKEIRQNRQVPKFSSEPAAGEPQASNSPAVPGQPQAA
jgi:hypothetical protein